MDKDSISKEIIEYYENEAQEPRLIDLPGVKELVEKAYRDGYEEAAGDPDYLRNCVYEYMRALEAKHE